MDVVFHFEVKRRIAVLVPDLHDLFRILLGDLFKFQGLIQLKSHGLFEIEMLARFQDSFAMLVVKIKWGGDDDDVQAFVFEQFSVVFVKGDCLA